MGCISWWFGACASLAFLLLCIFHPVRTSCPKNNGETLNWTTPMGDTIFSCADQFLSIWCCAQGFSQITWSRKIKGTSNRDDSEDVYPWDTSPDTKTDTEGQHLIFRKLSLNDSGWYQCVVTSDADQKTISHRYNLIVDDCSVCGGRPKIGKPISSQDINYYVELGSDFLTNCLASFGPASCTTDFFENLNVLIWYKAYNRTYCADTSNKFRGTKGEKMPDEPDVPMKLYEAFLNITNVTEADYGLYCCRAVDAGRHQVDRMIELKSGADAPSVTTTDTILETTVTVIGPILVITIIVLIALWFFRLDILLFCHTFRGRRPTRDAQYDVILIHSGSEEDNRFVERVLVPHLERELQCDVFLPRRDLDMGYIDRAYIDALRDSRKIILVLNEDFLTNPLCGHIHNYIISDNRNNDIIFIQRGNIESALWETKENITNIEVLRTSAKNAKRSLLGLGKFLIWKEKYECQSPLQDNIPIINNKFSRQIAGFWKQLCLYLPPRDGSVQMRFVPDQPSPSPNVI